jgi:FKBP-type peptidyl-prolyl cis-trans isomerase
MRIKILLAALCVVFAASCKDNGDSGVMREIEKGEAQEHQQQQSAAADSAHFMEQVRARPGVDVRPSGLVIEFVHHARQQLPPPPDGSTVLVHYEGALPNGQVFDSSIQRGAPAQFGLDQVIPGFSEALKLMHPGDAVIAYIPADIGYGAEGSPPTIPPNSALQFKLQLIAYRTPQGRTVQAQAE